MKIGFSPKPAKDTDLYLIAVCEGEARKAAGPHAAAIRAILKANPDFKGEGGAIVTAVVPGAKTGRVGLCGLGPRKARTALALEIAGGRILGAAMQLPVRDIFVDFSQAGATGADEIAALASGAALRGYEFRAYQTKNKDQHLPDSVTFGAGAVAQRAYAPMAKSAAAVHFARDLVNEPANVIYPESFARRVVGKLRPLGVKVTVLDEKQLAKKGFGAMLAVGRASAHKPRLVVMEYKGAGVKGAPVALVGKGITFDTGGYSIKPSDGMLEMKCDMAGAAAVAGAMLALAASRAKVHVVAALALAENMISDDGYRPSDILKSLSGQTIEVTNTDAEGRLVLCDAMWHVQKTYKPRAMVDIATLTGAAMVALGEEFAGLFSNDDVMRDALEAASHQTGDRVWRMPLDKAFDRAMDSNIADMKNAAATRYGGSCTAAAFLQRFVEKGVKWAHVDMAPVMVARADAPLCPRGATGFGVRLLSQWAQDA